MGCARSSTSSRTPPVTLYFITSARLFKDARGEPFTPATEVRVIIDDGTEVNVPREYRYIPIGNFSDIAVLRADVAASSLHPFLVRQIPGLTGRPTLREQP